jgi:FkbM family methyltransferase
MLNSLLALVGPESRVLVLGTHIGALAIPLAKKAREVVAYEANPQTFRLLQYNLKLNKIDNLVAFNLAVGDRPGKIEFFTSGVNSGGSGRRFDRSPALQLERANRIEVEMVRLSDHISDPRFDFVLMDIEGSEYLALQGMRPILATCSYLQFEYLPAVLRRSGVSDENLVAALGDNFAEFRVQGTDICAKRGDFLTLFKQLRRDNEHVDLLAVAERVRA